MLPLTDATARFATSCAGDSANLSCAGDSARLCGLSCDSAVANVAAIAVAIAAVANVAAVATTAVAVASARGVLRCCGAG